MGRPINKRYIGNTSQSGQQIQVTAFIPGDAGTSTAYISTQKGTKKYNAVNVTGASSGLVSLVDGGVALTAGQANITVQPFGSTGSNAAVTANLGIKSTTVYVAGSSDTTHYFVPGEVLSPSSGTASVVANLAVSSVTVGAVALSAAGTNYTVGDTLSWTYAGYSTAPVLTVTGTGILGNITTVGITVPGSVSNVNVTNVTPFNTAVTTNTNASGATFAIRWDLAALSVKDHGDYSSAPANPVALTGSAHGTGSSTNVTWQVSSVKVTNGGTGYQAAGVAFASGTASAVATVNAAGSISSVTVKAPGGPYTNTAPTVNISPIKSTEYARKVTNRMVETFELNEYEWVDSATTPVDGQAQIQTA